MKEVQEIRATLSNTQYYQFQIVVETYDSTTPQNFDLSYYYLDNLVTDKDEFGNESTPYVKVEAITGLSTSMTKTQMQARLSELMGTQDCRHIKHDDVLLKDIYSGCLVEVQIEDSTTDAKRIYTVTLKPMSSGYS